MDDFRIGSVPPYDPVGRHHSDDSSGGRRRRQSEPGDETEDVVELSEPNGEEEDGGTGYGPPRDR